MRFTVLMMAAALALSGLACNRASEGQETVRRDPDLEAKVAEIAARLEPFAYLSGEGTLAVRSASTATLEAYLIERLDQQYPGDSLESLSLAYQAFGLLPPDVDLRKLMIDLLLEQAIGYYDPAREILFIREEAPDSLVDAVIAHEIVHALQDQYIDLDSLVFRIQRNDARMAAQSAMEGHALAAMMAFQIAEITGSPTSAEALPELSPAMSPLLAASGQFPRLAAAPAIVREPLLFAYLGGARYIQRLWKQQPDHPPPFGEWLPESTEQLLHTERILGERDSPTPLVLSEPGEGWRTRYAQDLGELEILIYFQEHLGDQRAAAAAAAGWDGDAYALLSNGDVRALVWYTVWDSEADADEFADAYRQAFAIRFGGSGAGDALVGEGRSARIERLSISDMPAVRVVETPPGVELATPPEARVARTR